MKIFIYNKNESLEITRQQLEQIELNNRDLPQDEKHSIYTGDCFPPVGFKLVDGVIVNKTELEKLQSNEITLEQYNEPLIDVINKSFFNKANSIGVEFEGNHYQYDDISRSRLAEVKNNSLVTFWRSVDNISISLNNEKKNLLHDKMIETFYSEFYNKIQAIKDLYD